MTGDINCMLSRLLYKIKTNKGKGNVMIMEGKEGKTGRGKKKKKKKKKKSRRKI